MNPRKQRCFVFGLSLHKIYVLVLGTLLFGPALPAAVDFTVTPAAVSNTYNGKVTLQITGLTNGETVVVQKFLDINSNGAIDGLDLLWQQFDLTDGQVPMIGGVTNINVPGDTDPTTGQITTRLVLQLDEPTIAFIGRYAWRVSSPAGRFTPMTNWFAITNVPYPQLLTGSVFNSGTNVPNALVLIFSPPEPADDGNRLLAATLANHAGHYAIKVPPGDYVPVAFQSNFLGHMAAPPVTVGPGATVTANIYLSNATQTISGRMVDASNNSIGLPGLFLHVQTAALAALATSDTNGQFAMGVVPGVWRFGADGETALEYVGLDSDAIALNTTDGSVVTNIALPKASALFYGSVKDNYNQPVAGVAIYSDDDIDFFDANTVTDENGYYVVGVLSGQWEIDVENKETSSIHYVFSNDFYTNLNAGQAVLHNFTAYVAPYQITGQLQDTEGNPITNVYVSAFAELGGEYYSVGMRTDGSGNYLVNVANGIWYVGICCSCTGWNSNYCCPNGQQVIISNANAVANFIATAGGTRILTPSPLPDGRLGEYYSFQLEGESCGGMYWETHNPPLGLHLYQNGQLSGYPVEWGSNYFFVTLYDGFGGSVSKGFSLIIYPQTGTAGIDLYYVNKVRGYTQTNALSAVLDTNQGPFNACLGIVQSSECVVSSATATLPGSVVGTFPPGCSAPELQIRESFTSASAMDAAYPAGSYTFNISTADYGDYTAVLNMPASAFPNAPRISNYNAAQAIEPWSDFLLAWEPFAGASAGDMIRFHILEGDEVPPVTALDPATAVFSAWLTGNETSVTIPSFWLEPEHRYSGVLLFGRGGSTNLLDYPGALGVTLSSAQTVFPLRTVASRPLIAIPHRYGPSEFGFWVYGAEGQNCTIQKSTNLSSPTNWSVLCITNAPWSTFMVIDPDATNGQAFYRVLMGP